MGLKSLVSICSRVLHFIQNSCYWFRIGVLHLKLVDSNFHTVIVAHCIWKACNCVWFTCLICISLEIFAFHEMLEFGSEFVNFIWFRYNWLRIGVFHLKWFHLAQDSMRCIWRRYNLHRVDTFRLKQFHLDSEYSHFITNRYILLGVCAFHLE